MTQPRGSIVMWGTESKFDRIQGKYILGTMTFNSLTENGTRYSLTNFEDHFWIACQLFLDPICLALHLYCPVLPISSDNWQNQLLYYFTRVDLYSHQILLAM